MIVQISVRKQLVCCLNRSCLNRSRVVCICMQGGWGRDLNKFRNSVISFTVCNIICIVIYTMCSSIVKVMKLNEYLLV